MAHILAIDQGTSSTKALIFDQQGKVLAKGSAALESLYLPDGWVEQKPAEIYQNVLQALQDCLQHYSAAGFQVSQIQTCGISNQRETFVLWDAQDKPLYNAVVWQCKRSTQLCTRLLEAGVQEQIRAKTGLLVDPYFSGSKLLWLYENVPTVQKAIDRGEVYFGTVDTWLLYQLTKGQHFATDYSNASRTLLFNLYTLQWDADLLKIFQASRLNLPALKPSAARYGETDFAGLLPRPIPIQAMIGDSHAAAFGEGCFAPGEAKATLGTGCSILMNAGVKPPSGNSGMISTLCWSTAERTDYALEGAIVSCGATVEWLKNELGLFQDSRETAEMAKSVSSNGGVYLIPAFSGLGAPYWQMNRQASIHGLTFGSTKNHLVRAALESIVFQIKSVVNAMEVDSQMELKALMVNGGITANGFVMEALATLLGIPIVHRGMPDVSAFGAALLAGLEAGIFAGLEQLPGLLPQARQVEPKKEWVEDIHGAYEYWNELVVGSQASAHFGFAQ